MKLPRPSTEWLPLMSTVLVWLVLYVGASVAYEGFFSARVFLNLFNDNAALGISALGMTLVILSGGIDLSVGAVLALSTTLVAALIKAGCPAPIAMACSLGLGTALGAGMGGLIHAYRLPPFLVTLGGMFLARGTAFWISMESMAIRNPLYDSVTDYRIALPGKAFLTAGSLMFLGMMILAWLVAHRTPFGRNLYALGGNEQSARLMGLPILKTRVSAYALNGFCSALAGLAMTFYMGSGNPAIGMGMELDVIACVVIGGTLLTGGSGWVAGTLFGVLIFGTIQTAITFDGRLNSYWSRMVIGFLLLAFILLQRGLTRNRPASHT